MSNQVVVEAESQLAVEAYRRTAFDQAGSLAVEGSLALRELAARILGVARGRRRDRVVLELVCIDWELSHLAAEQRAALEQRLAQRFEVSSFGRMLEDSVRGRSTGPDWSRLFAMLGI